MLAQKISGGEKREKEEIEISRQKSKEFFVC